VPPPSEPIDGDDRREWSVERGAMMAVLVPLPIFAKDHHLILS